VCAEAGRVERSISRLRRLANSRTFIAPLIRSGSVFIDEVPFRENLMPRGGTTKHEKELSGAVIRRVASTLKRGYTRQRTESGHPGRTDSSAPSLKRKLTGDTWSHHQMSLSLEKHAEEVLCVWYPTLARFTHTFSSERRKPCKFSTNAVAESIFTKR